ncbi:MAG: CopG family transcriptional regulator [Dehalococcoidia bacterium]|nr:CopG family transcriptional regulator [Dehalococcoidia bacterium]
MSTRLLQIRLPENLIKEIQAEIEGTSFKSVENFVETLVMRRFHELEQPVYNAEEEEIIKERLRKLGYFE